MAARLDDLTYLRTLIIDSLAECEPEKRAPLVARLESVIAQIEKLSPDAKAGDPVDEIAKRRAARGAGSAASEGGPDSNSG